MVFPASPATQEPWPFPEPARDGVLTDNFEAMPVDDDLDDLATPFDPVHSGAAGAIPCTTFRNSVTVIPDQASSFPLRDSPRQATANKRRSSWFSSSNFLNCRAYLSPLLRAPSWTDFWHMTRHSSVVPAAGCSSSGTMQPAFADQSVESGCVEHMCTHTHVHSLSRTHAYTHTPRSTHTYQRQQHYCMTHLFLYTPWRCHLAQLLLRQPQ